MLFSDINIPGNPGPGANHTMLDHAALGTGWYWPSRHDYYLYESPPRIPNDGVSTYTNMMPSKLGARNPHFMKPLSNYTAADEYNYHPHQSQYTDGSYELDLYPDDEIPNFSSVSVETRREYTVPNGGSCPAPCPDHPNGVTYGWPRFTLVSPNTAFAVEHFGVERKSDMEGNTGGIADKILQYYVEGDFHDENDTVKPLYIQRAAIREFQHIGCKGGSEECYREWPDWGYDGSELTYSLLDWTPVFGPVNWRNIESLVGGNNECLDCDTISSKKLREDPNQADYFGNEFQLDNINVSRRFRSGDTDDTVINFRETGKFIFPLLPPKFAKGGDPLAEIFSELPMFIYDQDSRVGLVGHRFDGFNQDRRVASTYNYQSMPPFEITQVGATFDMMSLAFGGDSGNPYFTFYPHEDTPNTPILMGLISGGERLHNIVRDSLPLLSGLDYDLVDGSERSLQDDAAHIEGRLLSREYFGYSDCDYDVYPTCLYSLDINAEYQDSFIDMGSLYGSYQLGTEKHQTSVNNINSNVTLVYSTQPTAVGSPSSDPVQPKIFRIEHSDPSNPTTLERTISTEGLADHIDVDYGSWGAIYLAVYGFKPAKPQEMGNYVYVAIAGSNSDAGGPKDSGRVVILNKSDLSNATTAVTEITGAGTDGEMFGTEMATNGKELFISASAHKVEQYTQTDPKVYVYEPLHDEDDVLTEVSLVQTIDAVSHTENDRFGWALDATENWLVIGSPGTEDYGGSSNPVPEVSGKVHIYKKNASGTWDLNTTVDSSSTINDEQLNTDSLFGHSVSIHGDYIAVGCPRDNETIDNVTDQEFGSVFIFKYASSANAWIYDQKITFDDLYTTFVDLTDPVESNFGWEVELGPKSLLVSGPNMESGFVGLNKNAGIAFLFTKEGGFFTPRDSFDGLSFQSEKLGKTISLYEETSINDDTQVTKRTITLPKVKKSFIEQEDHNKATAYILKSTDETNVNDNPGNTAGQDPDFEGYFDNPDDRVLSGRAVIQDSHIWQDYSYILNVSTPGSTGSTGEGTTVILQEEFERPFKDFMHTSGLQFFGMATLDDVVGGGVPTGGVISLEGAIVAHYMPYTFNTIQNLRYNENQADLYPQGFNANATGASYGADDGYTNDNVYATMPENAPYGITHINLGFPYGISGSSFGYNAADQYGYPYWMIFNHPNVWASNVTGPSGSPENSGGYTLGSAASFGSIVLDDIISMDIDIVKVQTNAPAALLQSPNIGNVSGTTGNPLLYGLVDGPTGGIQY